MLSGAGLDFDNTRLPLPIRVALYAAEHDQEPLRPGELRDALGVHPASVSRAINQARRMRILTANSHARCLEVYR